MKTKRCLGCWHLGFLGFLTTVWLNSFADRALPQNTPSNIQADDTLGAESSQIIQNFQGQPLEVITGGATRSINLFHSFREFNISEGREAYFSSPNTDIQNILARVTGRNRSEILGRLGTFGESKANLFLINPNGILFGKNASLDVDGSFAATTANAIQFGETGNFSATNPEVPQLLAINPSAFLFSQINKTASIQNNAIAPTGKDPAGFDAVGLRVPDGKSLLLLGGNVSMDGGQLNALGGRVELGGLAESGNINLVLDGDNLRLGFIENVTRADVSLTNQAAIYVEGTDGGHITVNARNVEILAGSLLSAGIGQGLGTPETKAGDITLNATEQVKVEQGSQIRNDVFPNATRRGGDLTITTKELFVRDGAKVGTNTFAAGKGGNLTINASNSVQLIGTSINGRSSLSTFAGRGSTGDVGNLTINTQDLLVRDGAEISSSTLGAGKGGNLSVNAIGRVQVVGRSADDSFSSGLFASANQGSTGDAGNLIITTKDLLVRDGAEVIVSTFSTGKGGNLTVNASNSVQLIGTSADGSFSSGLFAEATLDSIGDAATGEAGNLTITTKELLVDDGAEVSASTFGASKGGDLTIKVQNLLVQNGARVTAGTFGAGKGGNLIVNASNNVQLIGTSADGSVASGLGTPASRGSTGDAGDLTITTKDLSVRDGARITAYTFGRGTGGNLNVNASNSVQLIGTSTDGDFPSALLATAQPSSTANAGNLTINTQDLLVRDGAQVSASVFGRGQGGNLTVNALNSVQLIGTSADGRFSSGLFADVRGRLSGDGGDLTINTRDLLVRDGAQVGTGTLGRGKGGNLTVNASNSMKAISGSADDRLPSGLFSSAQPGSTGDGGNFTINTQDLLVMGAQVSTGTFGRGKGGNLTVNANHVQLIGKTVNDIDPSGLFTATEQGSTGNAGDLTINTRQLFVRDRAGVFVNSRGTGNAGIMTINADTIRLDNQASLNANTRSPNKDPNREQATINLNTQNLTLRRNSSITTNASGENVIGGNININTKFLIAPENSRISANSDNFRGGRVRINAQGVFVGNKLSDVSNYITATSGVGLSGSVDVNSPDNSSLQNSLTELSQNLIDTNALLANSCIVRSQEKQQSSFIITGTGGLPNRPSDASMSNYSTGDVRNITNENTSFHWKKGDPIIEPQGVYRLWDGKLVMSRECQND
ncbi:hypothetical protein WA1_08670 [Scytonema hofmannii PCC 7110]|uniref:Filamentous haemagglutinin FhaB/tRNA nuclease CdiA-like TPS domain-containing protein n=1 Tax=Scytonema hofmannii PCC 7110 TaxID=128403 RepID=A0A139WS09_9CYAN|nr:filamentous hemagglutinin N-terminal domain-containing protein [Scytonema hofmannii]KYC35221.1 hypothetical protein WA1_08670 [Scytonema hofmannii PCC 7110]